MESNLTLHLLWALMQPKPCERVIVFRLQLPLTTAIDILPLWANSGVRVGHFQEELRLQERAPDFEGYLKKPRQILVLLVLSSILLFRRCL